MLLVPGVARLGEDVAGTELDPSTELLIEPRPAEREECILVDATPDGLDLQERVVEPLQPSLEDLSGIGERNAIQLDLVLGDPVPGGLRDHAVVAIGEQGLFHAGGDDQQVRRHGPPARGGTATRGLILSGSRFSNWSMQRTSGWSLTSAS